MRLCICWGRCFEGTVENSLWKKMFKCNQCDYESVRAGNFRTLLKPTLEKIIIMQPIRLCICLSKKFEDTFEISLQKQIIQGKPVQLCICSGRQFDHIWNFTHRRKVVQMQPMRLCMCSGRRFKKTFGNSFWRKIVKMQPLLLWICSLG